VKNLAGKNDNLTAFYLINRNLGISIFSDLIEGCTSTIGGEHLEAKKIEAPVTADFTEAGTRCNSKHECFFNVYIPKLKTARARNKYISSITKH
jgi:hypothetical protein